MDALFENFSTSSFVNALYPWRKGIHPFSLNVLNIVRYWFLEWQIFTSVEKCVEKYFFVLFTNLNP